MLIDVSSVVMAGQAAGGCVGGAREIGEIDV